MTVLDGVLRAGLRALAAAVAIMLFGVLGAVPLSAYAAGASPHWSVRAIALPSEFSPSQEDEYQILVTNTGAAASEAEVPVVIAASLSPQLSASLISGTDWASGEELECSQELLQCEDHASVPPDDTLAVTILVKASSAEGTAVSKVTVSGGGVDAVDESAETPLVPEAPGGVELAPFAIESFGFSASGVDGMADLQAAGHPYEQTTSFELMSNSNEDAEESPRPFRNPRDIAVTLPEGFVGNPLAAPRCPVKALEEASFNEHFETVAPCPKGSRVGLVTLVDGRSGGAVGTLDKASLTTPLYNLAPEAGHPAELGFSYLRQYAIVIYANLVHTSAGYRLRVTIPGVPILAIDGAVVTLFGDPGVRNEETGATGAFLTNPAQCGDEPLSAKLEVNSWEEPHTWLSAESVSYPEIAGCNLLQFSPEVRVTPEQTPAVTTAQTVLADSPDGYEVDIKVPHAESPWSLLSSPELKGVTVTLPAGLSVSPSAADGLEGCAATGPNGIDIPHGSAHPDEAGEGEAIGPDGLSYLTEGHCPPKSRIGEVEISTPLLEHPLTGAIYIAEPKCGGAGQKECTSESASNGELYGLYLEAAGSGAVIKLAGKVSVDPVTGRLTTTFQENPELPVSEVKVKLNGGPRAPLASPQSCGVAETETELEPWSAPITPDAEPTSSFDVVGCGVPMPFAPSLTAGTTSNQAGGYSPFTLSFSRQDREQDLLGLSVTLPPGLLGRVAGVPLCGEAQANAGKCGPESEIGTASALAGPGEHPLYVSGGHVYLTTGYKNQPFGLSIVVPAVAGPFNLGNVVVRASIHINPETSQATVESDPLPQSRDGVPFRLRTVYTEINRPGGFTFNPTNCSRQQITATIGAAQGASAKVSTPFQAANCANLTFKPKFSASTSAKPSKVDGTSLHVSLLYPPAPFGSQANVANVHVELPKALPARLSTLNHACLDSVFNQNPAGCPAQSRVGYAKAVTPVLPVPLEGPAYFVSHGGQKFPELIIVLQGDGVTLDLAGETFISKAGITSSTFKSVPDVPVASFELTLPQGPFSALAANGNPCTESLEMPTRMTAQNGAVVEQRTDIAVSGCKPAIRVVGHSVKGSHAGVRVTVPSAGTLVATGAGIRRSVKRVAKAGTVTIGVTLSSHGLGVLAKNPHQRVNVKVKLRFTPKHGPPLTAYVSLLMG